MSSERKVIILFLLLIAFIVGCVYYHLPEMMRKQQAIQNEPKQEVILNNAQEQASESEEIIDLEKATMQQDETLVESNETTKEETPTVEDTTNQTQELNKEEAFKEEIVEEIIEEPKEPLIKTPKDYIREGDEKRIEELSFPTQELQLQINDYIDNNPISFKRGKYTIANNKSVNSIKEIVKILEENPNIKLEIAGHTDAAGSKDVNLTFSLERAKTVVKVMKNLGIDENRIKARGYGEDIPKNVKNVYSPENRRVEFNIIEE